MQDELERRAATAEQFGLARPLDLDPPEHIGDAHVLAITKSSDDRQVIETSLDSSLSLVHLDDMAAGMDMLLQGGIDGAIVGAQGNDDDSLVLCADIRSNARLFNLPLVLIADSRGFFDPIRPYLSGANAVVHRPVDAHGLKAYVTSLIKQNRYRTKMRAVYREFEDDIITDSLTRLYSFGFLHAHLARQLEDAQRWEKNLSLGFFNVKNMKRLNEEFGYVAGDRLLRQMGALVGTLVRGEDVAARYSGEKFCVVQPETAEDVAKFALQRIVGVIGNTDFALPNVDTPVRARLAVGSASIRPGDTAASLIARARDRCLEALR